MCPASKLLTTPPGLQEAWDVCGVQTLYFTHLKSKQKITRIPEMFISVEIRENYDSDKSDYAGQNNVELVKSNSLNVLNP